MDDTCTPLLERIRRGETAALAEYLEGHRVQLLAYISRTCGPALRSKIEPEDLLQEVTMEALRRIGELAALERDLFGWLCQIAEYRLIDAHRRFFGTQKRAAGLEVGMNAPANDTQTPLINMLVASMTSPSQAFSRNQKEIQLHEALASLPPEGREALKLRYVDNLPSKQIAERLGKSDGAVRVLLTRSLSRLQAAMEDTATG